MNYNGDNSNNKNTVKSDNPLSGLQQYGNGGNDSLTFDSGSSLSDQLTLSGGTGSDKLVIKASRASSNLIEGGDDKDTLQVAVSQKIGTATSVTNSLDAGDGGSKIDLSVKSKDNIAYSNGDVITGGDGKDSIKLDVSGKSEYAPLTRIQYLDIDAEGGDNTIRVGLKDSATTYGDVSFTSSEIRAGNGKDKVDVSVKGNRDATASGVDLILGFGDDKSSIKVASKDGIARWDSGEIALSEGKNQSKFDVKSGDRSEINDNTISSGTDDDKLEFKVSSKDGVHFEDNSITAGDGENTIKINISGDGDVDFKNNTLSGGNNDDTIDVKVTNKFVTNLEVSENTISAGGGDDSIKIDAKAKGGAFAGFYIATASGYDEVDLMLSGNQATLSNTDIYLGTEEDELNITLKATDYVARIVTTDIDTGDQADEVNLKLSSKGNVQIDNLNLFTSGGDDTIEVDAKSSKGGSFLTNSNINLGGGDDTIVIKSKSSTGVGFGDNTISGGTGNDTVILDLKDGKDYVGDDFVLANDTFVSGGDDDDLLVFKGKGQDIDLTSGPLTINGFETIDIGANSLTTTSAEVGFMGLGADPDLFIEGKGDLILSDFNGAWNDEGLVIIDGGKWQHFQSMFGPSTVDVYAATAVDVAVI